MLKYFSVIILLSGITFCQTAKATFVKEVEVESKYIIWHSYVMDSTYLNTWDANGDLLRRVDNTYLYWQTDASGKLIPIRIIDYRLPIFNEAPLIANKEGSVFD